MFSVRCVRLKIKLNGLKTYDNTAAAATRTSAGFLVLPDVGGLSPVARGETSSLREPKSSVWISDETSDEEPTWHRSRILRLAAAQPPRLRLHAENGGTETQTELVSFNIIYSRRNEFPLTVRSNQPPTSGCGSIGTASFWAAAEETLRNWFLLNFNPRFGTFFLSFSVLSDQNKKWKPVETVARPAPSSAPPTSLWLLNKRSINKFISNPN